MTFLERTIEQMSVFVDKTRPFLRELLNVSISYIAFEERESPELFKAQVIIGGYPLKEIEVNLDGLKAGRINVSNAAGFDIEKFLNSINSGFINVAETRLRIPENSWPTFVAANEEGIAQQQKWCGVNFTRALLTIPNEVHEDLSWKLRSLDEPIDGLNELLFELGLANSNKSAVLEVVFLAGVVFDFSSSVEGQVAALKVRLAHGLQVKKVSLGYKILDRGQVTKRGAIKGDRFDWEDTGAFLAGTYQLNVPEAALLQCFARYDGIAQHHGWCGDVSRFQNFRRNLYDFLDPQQEALKRLIFEQGRSGNARFMEMGIDRLLWMLGFSTIHLGGSANTQNFVDLIAVTPDDQVLLIECTSGPIKIDKLINLVDRKKAVEEMFNSSGSSHIKLDAIFITARGEAGLDASMEAAKRLNIIIATREDIEAAIVETAMLPKPIMLLQRLRSKMQLLATTADSGGH